MQHTYFYRHGYYNKKLGKDHNFDQNKYVLNIAEGLLSWFH